MGNKIAIVLGSNIHWAPYYYRYERLLQDEKCPFDLIYWNREGIKEESAANLISFNVPDVSNNKDPLKVFKFIRFSRFVQRTIEREKYDKLIFLGTHGCAVSFCATYLAKHYRDKIWIDIRDDEYEWFPPFYWGEKKSIDASYATAISSYRYTKFLPPHDYLYIHNIDPNASQMQQQYVQVPENNVIRISFIGNVRYYEQNTKLIEQLGNDKRFRLQFFGKGSDRIQKYCEENGIHNTSFFGFFPQNETLRFYEQTDIINNNYGNETLNLQTALSNKLYYALFLRLPLLVSENTFMEELTKQFDLSFSFTESADFADALACWYNQIQAGIIIPRYSELWEKVQAEDAACMEKLREFICSR